MILGFTGTREGMTVNQRSQIWSWLGRQYVTEFHHGCCVGADTQCADLVLDTQAHSLMVGHPSTLSGHYSRLAAGICNSLLPARPPLERNRDIVDTCDVLLACPKGPEEVRSGTWATIRYARKCGKRIVIVWPNGEVTEENTTP